MASRHVLSSNSASSNTLISGLKRLLLCTKSSSFVSPRSINTLSSCYCCVWLLFEIRVFVMWCSLRTFYRCLIIANLISLIAPNFWLFCLFTFWSSISPSCSFFSLLLFLCKNLSSLNNITSHYHFEIHIQTGLSEDVVFAITQLQSKSGRWKRLLISFCNSNRVRNQARVSYWCYSTIHSFIWYCTSRINCVSSRWHWWRL